FFFQAEDGIRDFHVTGVQTCALPIFLVSSVGGGVAEVDPADPDHVTRYSRLNGMIDDQVWSVMEDREGNVWFGQNGGLSRLRFEIGRASCRERAWEVEVGASAVNEVK